MNICIFCGSSAGAHPAFLEAANNLGRNLAEQDIGVVYGGARIGLMGAVADGALAAGGKVIGVIPQAIADIEVAHEGLTELHVVESMHARKAMMADHSSAFIALPGGIGTLEELFEVWTWTQLGIHNKAIGLLNVNGFYDQLLAFLDHLQLQEFVKPAHRSLLVAEEHARPLIDKLLEFSGSTESKL